MRVSEFCVNLACYMPDVRWTTGLFVGFWMRLWLSTSASKKVHQHRIRSKKAKTHTNQISHAIRSRGRLFFIHPFVCFPWAKSPSTAFRAIRERNGLEMSKIIPFGTLARQPFVYI